MIGLTVKNIIIKKQLNFFFKVPGVLFCTIFEDCLNADWLVYWCAPLSEPQILSTAKTWLFFWYLVVLQIKHDHHTKKIAPKKGNNLKIQKVSNSEKIQKVDLNVEKDCKQKMSCLWKKEMKWDINRLNN